MVLYGYMGASAGAIIVYTTTFISLYVEVFLLITFFEYRKKIAADGLKLAPEHRYPSVAIVVPCWNEEKTIYRTVRSLLALNYPKNKLKIILVDDGSTDRTWEILKKFNNKFSNVEVLHKENGGKHTAVNYAIENTTTEIIGCLDADSFVHPDALTRLVAYFDDPEVMAVAPTIIIHEPKSIVQFAQRVEYYLGVYVKKMLGLMNGIHVTPGPFSFFRRAVFEKVGKFREAHNTEDMEIAYRMQEAGLKIAHCHTAYVYTVGPKNVQALYRQRLRWIYGFINNTIDYRRLVFRKRYGVFGLYTLPAGIIGITTVLYLCASVVYRLGNFIYTKIQFLTTVGFSTLTNPQHSKLDFFFVDTHALVFVTLFLYIIVLSSLFIGKLMAGSRPKLSIDIVLFLLVYTFIAPFWIVKAIYNTVIAKKPSWR
jgi:cellulose synthase/poly-beta-1,6-N-acetylglucosamine synthase-like glycosyltransferase